jgi:hypothetical protein
VDHKGWLKPAHLLQSIQLICYNWFSQKKHRLTPAPPDFALLLQMITLNTYMLPWLPPALNKLAHPRPGSLFQLPLQEVGSLKATSSSGSSNANSGSSNATTVSGITHSSGTHPASTNHSQTASSQPPDTMGNRRGSYIANLTPGTTLTSLVPAGVKIKTLMGTDPPPVLDNGSQVCLSFLVRHGCWSSCRRAHTHNVKLSNNEKLRIANYLQTQATKVKSAAPAHTLG